MKALNPLKFLTEIATEIEKYKTNIRNAENIERARQNALAMHGYVNCTITFLNTMLDTENNDFTENLSELIDEWQQDIFGLLADKAIELKQDPDWISRLLNRRDEIGA